MTTRRCPHTLVAETEHWLVLVRPQQPTFGALVLACKDEAKAFSGITVTVHLTPITSGRRELLQFAGEVRHPDLDGPRPPA